ncbi:B3 domain-containing protein Os04g0386900-like [Rhododendron vialii]|uniref:B3 domain-containing protein Os04g0386900-like n=1 Tax=Rhododendron vialii TaxID=182163 RepID=UPI00265EAF06|nr:B3 domain-containing protein Os04g0386900-like [Rhododendron vialii]XP_058225118.1 B3 domain-containing protein Os04g0386900-like [Rhododendron vialii]XP_058225119.1 B3 domain-containing protein Os04g0386900-like [Rhododendron vialii]
MEPLAGIPVNEVEDNQVENPQATPTSNSGKSELKKDEFWPLSGKPYFSVVLCKSHLKPRYQLVLPGKICQALPDGCVPVVLTYCGKNWGMMYLGCGDQKKFDSTWKSFVHDNDLEIGDACVFELVESNIDIIRFRVQILRGDFPAELEERVNGETSSTPIILD